jgi:nitronate monooxygenase
MGADFAYMGSSFIATEEANAPAAYKQSIVGGCADDIVYSNFFTGVWGNYLRSSIVAAGLDPDKLPLSDASVFNIGGSDNAEPKVWRDIWGCGQGIGAVTGVLHVSELITALEAEYLAACRTMTSLSDQKAFMVP